MYKPTLITGPSEPVITLADAKVHLRVDGDDEDGLVDGLIAAALSYFDGWSGILGRCLVAQTWQVTADAFCRRMRLPLPATSVASIKYRNSAGTLSAAISAGSYSLLSDGRGSYVRFAGAYAYPGDLAESEGAVIQFVAGYGAVAAVPMAIRQAMLLLIGHWYANREAVSGGAGIEVPLAVASLIAPFRLRNV